MKYTVRLAHLQNAPTYKVGKMQGDVMRIYLLFIWQLPQNILGLCLLALLRKRILVRATIANTFVHIVALPNFGISLGSFVFLDKGYPDESILHEIGHHRQSEKLGFLYLPVVGTVSLTLSILSRFVAKIANNYHSYWPENWADELGGL